MSDACICAIAKNEDLYLDEWIQYHLALGFKHIFLYDNHDEPTLDKILRSFIIPLFLKLVLSKSNITRL